MVRLLYSRVFVGDVLTRCNSPFKELTRCVCSVISLHTIVESVAPGGNNNVIPPIPIQQFSLFPMFLFLINRWCHHRLNRSRGRPRTTSDDRNHRLFVSILPGPDYIHTLRTRCHRRTTGPVPVPLSSRIWSTTLPPWTRTVSDITSFIHEITSLMAADGQWFEATF